MDKKTLLLIIDPQYDFIEGGKLAVNGGKAALDRLVEYLKGHHKEYGAIIITTDWHPITHCSFKDNGGIWPTHCVQFSTGAAIYQPILDVLDETKTDYTVLTKGCNEDHEEYSIFKNDKSRKVLEALADNTAEVHYCALALDYCVKDSLLDGKKVLTNAKACLLKDCTAAIGNPEDTYKILEENNVELI